MDLRDSAPRDLGSLLFVATSTLVAATAPWLASDRTLSDRTLVGGATAPWLESDSSQRPATAPWLESDRTLVSDSDRTLVGVRSDRTLVGVHRCF